MYVGLPWWLSGEEPFANAGNTGSIPGRGGSHIPWETKPMCHNQLLSLCSSLGASTTEAHTP